MDQAHDPNTPDPSIDDYADRLRAGRHRAAHARVLTSISEGPPLYAERSSIDRVVIVFGSAQSIMFDAADAAQADDLVRAINGVLARHAAESTPKVGHTSALLDGAVTALAEAGL